MISYDILQADTPVHIPERLLLSPLSIFEPTRFKSCGDRAWSASVQLVAACSNMSVKDIESLYRLEADVVDKMTDDLLDDLEENVEHLETMKAAQLQKEADKGGLQKVLSAIEETASEHFHGQDEDADVDNPVQVPDTDAALPDGEKLIDLTKGDTKDELGSNWQPPQTLTDALCLGICVLPVVGRHNPNMSTL